MKNIATLLLVVLCGCAGKTDSTAEKVTAPAAQEEDETVFNGPCVYQKTGYSKIFPASKADHVELVSYQTRRDSYSNTDLINEGKFLIKEIEQRVALNKIQRDSLFSILFNYRPSPVGLDTLQADCYLPRHSVVFYEEKKAIAFLELCFECLGSKHTLGADFGQFCPEKWCVLQKFFKDNKVTAGLIDELCE